MPSEPSTLVRQLRQIFEHRTLAVPPAAGTANGLGAMLSPPSREKERTHATRDEQSAGGHPLPGRFNALH